MNALFYSVRTIPGKFVFLFTLTLFFCGTDAFGQVNWYKFPTGIPEAANRYIYIDKNNDKWIGGYSNGLHKLSNGVWTHYNKSNSKLSDDDVRQSCFDTSGNLWMATWNNLNKYNVATNTWTKYNVTGVSYDVLYSVQVDTKNRIWVGAGGGGNPDDGLYMYNGVTWKFYNPTNSALKAKWILPLIKDLNGRIWGCNYKGLFEINDTTIIDHSFLSAGFSSSSASICLAVDRNNNKWVGVYGGGVGKYNGTNWTIYTKANSSLPDDAMWSIAVDTNNIVWIGTETKGLVKFDGINWTTYNSSNSPISSDRIDALAVDKYNNLWIAPNYGGIVVHNASGITGVCRTQTTQSVTTCQSYVWRGKTYTSSGVYTDSVTTAEGCDSVIVLNLSINTLDTSVTLSTHSLTANATGVTYKWLNCANNFAVISGATNQTFTPTVTGNYAVLVTQNNCSDTSSCYPITVNTGIDDYDYKTFELTVHPNPSKGLFFIEQKIAKLQPYEVTDIAGNKIQEGILMEKQTSLDLSKIESGIYILRVGERYIKLTRQ